MFMQNAYPYLEVRRPFILGTAKQQWKATLSHHFFELLHEQGKLTRLYTQNIDGLDFQTQIPNDKIVPVHGSIGGFRNQRTADQPHSPTPTHPLSNTHPLSSSRCRRV